MKRIFLIVTVCILALIINRCKKPDTTSTPVNTAVCTTCPTEPLVHKPDAAGVFYYVPTAFTPNGDGMNDVFQVSYDKLNTDSSVITIWDMQGTMVFTGKITQRWEGVDLKGAKCPAGQYPVNVKLMDINGTVVNTCTCVTLLKYSGSCIPTGGTTYYFPDQIDVTTGFSFATNDKLCP